MWIACSHSRQFRIADSDLKKISLSSSTTTVVYRGMSNNTAGNESPSKKTKKKKQRFHQVAKCSRPDKEAKRDKSQHLKYETRQREAVMSDESIKLASTHKCTFTKTCQCMNGHLCLDIFGKSSFAQSSIRLTREQIWNEGSPGPKNRRENLQELILSMVVVDEDGNRTIPFFLCNGKRVCKSFFRVS